jgi:hypothetical protein
MNDSNLSCRDERRRDDVRVSTLSGLDYVEVVDEQQLTLNVFFLGKAPQNFHPANVVLTGGRRIRDVQIKSVTVKHQSSNDSANDPTLDDYLEIRVNKAGDFSDYTISLVNVVNGLPTTDPMLGVDRRYYQVSFSFKASCPTDLDCKSVCTCPPPQRTEPDIDYLAKDYESFRQLILDRLALIMPEWTETHVPDVGIMLVELLAYVGDYLSYYQDAVATEAYIGTARQRISVRRHARLVDYLMHDGCNARAWLTLWTDTDEPFDPTQIYFTTPYPGAPVSNHILTPADFLGVDPSTYEVFEPLYWNGDGPIVIRAAHSEIHFYTWGDCQCCLAPGTTSATLIDAWVPAPAPPTPAPTTPPNPPGTPPTGTTPPTPTSPAPAGTPAAPTPPPAPAPRAAVATGATTTTSDGPPGTVRSLQLKVGDILIFEEVLGPKTGAAPDADPSHRQAVRLTSVNPGIDPLYGQQPYGTPIIEIEWASEDALTFPLCISSQNPPPDCGCLENVSVARGNVILVDNGLDIVEIVGTVPTDSTQPQCPKCCEPASTTIFPGTFRPVLAQEPLTFSVPLPPACSAADFMRQDPRPALPCISLTSIPAAPTCLPSDPTQPPPPCVIPPLFTFDDLNDPSGLAVSLHALANPNPQFLFAQLSPSTQQALTSWNGILPLPQGLGPALINDLSGLLQRWTVQRDLLESGPDDFDFVVEVDDDGYGHIRFGDGVCGRQPDAGTLLRANYRIHNGKAGNVGAETITYIVLRTGTLSGVNLGPRNPMPASGGTDPEPIDQVRLLAPYAFQDQLERAITADDYATIAADNERRLEARATLEAEDSEICTATFTRLQAAKAALRWTGSWYTALVALDPMGEETAPEELIDEITLYLQPYRRMGYDLLVSQANYVPLKVRITVCVQPNYLRGHVERAVLDALSNRVLPDGTKGFFHPDNLSFGDGVYVSSLLAVVQAIPGVQNVMVTELERFEISEPLLAVDQPGEELPANWALLLGPFEIAQLDNDPNFPENGVLVLDVEGGR